jgi:hypothetical protein
MAGPVSSYNPTGLEQFLSNKNNREITKKYIKDIRIHYWWSSLEPKKDVYDFSLIDKDIERINKFNREEKTQIKLVVSLGAGWHSPEWIYEVPCIRRFYFRNSNELAWNMVYGEKYCMPNPFDDKYLKIWIDFIKALGKQYDQNQTILHIEMAGINMHTDEILVPLRQKPPLKEPTGDPIPPEEWNDIKHWQEQGLTKKIMLEAFSRIVEAYHQSFPSKPFVINSERRFLPLLDDNGQYNPQIDPDPLTIAVRDAIKRYPKHCFFQSNNLKSEKSAKGMDYSFRDSLVKDYNATVGYQFGRAISQHPEIMCGPDEQPLDCLKSLIDNAVKHHASYVEIFQADILNKELRDGIVYAAEKLNK